MFVQLVMDGILNRTSTGWVKSGGQILNVVILFIVVTLQLFVKEVALRDKEGDIGGGDVAIIVIVFEFVAPPGLVKVSVTV